jgi:hypothetical protein
MAPLCICSRNPYQTEGSQESCAPAMANGGKVLGSICPMAILGELLFSFELCILSCDDERGMSYGGMIVHDSYVPSITNFFWRPNASWCLCDGALEVIVSSSPVTRSSSACCESFKSIKYNVLSVKKRPQRRRRIRSARDRAKPHKQTTTKQQPHAKHREQEEETKKPPKKRAALLP